MHREPNWKSLNIGDKGFYDYEVPHVGEFRRNYVVVSKNETHMRVEFSEDPQGRFKGWGK